MLAPLRFGPDGAADSIHSLGSGSFGFRQACDPCLRIPDRVEGQSHKARSLSAARGDVACPAASFALARGLHPFVAHGPASF